MSDYHDIVIKYRKQIIEGRCLNHVPVQENMLKRIIELRNDSRNAYFLNQNYKLSLDDQIKWFNSYLTRSNDLYWVIVDKKNNIVGTNRLYDIDDNQCVQGSIIVDEKHSLEAPYALESILLAIKFAFEKLKVATIINEDRYDNKVMNSITKRVGFEYKFDVDTRGITCKHYELTKKQFKERMLTETLETWLSRRQNK